MEQRAYLFSRTDFAAVVAEAVGARTWSYCMAQIHGALEGDR